MRSGTENLISIAAFAAAAKAAEDGFEENSAAVVKLRAKLDTGLEGLRESGVAVKKPERSADGIVNITLPGIRSETMLNYLSGRDICVSAGSACSAYSKKKSAALAAFGCSDAEIDSSIRVSLSHMNSEDDVSALIAALTDGIRTLRRGGGKRR